MVAENNTYSDAHLNFDLTQHDRIVILEDTDHDGRADRHTVFWDKAQKLTSVEIGFGGVWGLPAAAPLYPRRNGDDHSRRAAAGRARRLGRRRCPAQHRQWIAWGPDGWLYGRHGIQATSYVGVPARCLAAYAA